jgi:hypothetical protein
LSVSEGFGLSTDNRAAMYCIWWSGVLPLEGVKSSGFK